LVRRARDGDEAAHAVLYERWLPRMRARVRRRLHGRLRRRVAESDVVQDACLTAFMRLEDFEGRGDGSFGRWLTTIVDRKARAAIRRHVGTAARDVRREVPQLTESGSEHVRAPEPTPSVALMSREQAMAVQRTLDDLPAAYRDVLRLVHGQGVSLAEAGERLGRSANAAGKLYARALAALGKRLEREQP
jgi:RNA polymerase sigma-70 factor (ECF subfamily)